ncbi:MFS transporter [Rhodococcus qingshengii]|uniref:MFS transporter n=1 Tax=Rhodococcus qingshengii TaxID=334542 RepID=A0A2A5JC10_RHOSG|nr:MFS transporter [Rhodococcus qingshengii]PCK26511.1 MFS transporter [Rhodococcus qingshengii]
MSRRSSESRTKAWSLTLLLVMLYIINTSDKALIGLVAQPLAEEFGLSSSQIGLLGSVFFVTFTIGGFFAGLLNKWMTLRWSLVVLALVWAATMVPVIVVSGFTVLVICRLVLGLAEGPSGALIYTAAYSWHPTEKRGLPGALITCGGSLAKIFVAPLLAIIIGTWGWRAAFIAMSIAGLVWCIAWLTLWREGPYGKSLPEKSASCESMSAAKSASVPWLKIFLTPTFLGGVAALIAMYCLFTVVLTWLPSYFEKGLGYSRVNSGIMFAIPSLVGMVALILTTGISDRLLSRGGSARILRGVLPAVALLICGILLAALPYISNPALAVTVMSFGYGVGNINFPLINAAVSQICPPKQVAGTLGVLLALMAVGGLVAPFATGLIVDAAVTPAVGYATAFQIFGIVAVVAALIALVTINPTRDAARVHGKTLVAS